ncbi:MAG: hypothetical protein WCG44_03125, partial [bacterium]
MKNRFGQYGKILMAIGIFVMMMISLTQIIYAKNGERWSRQYGCRGKGCVDSVYVPPSDVGTGKPASGLGTSQITPTPQVLTAAQALASVGAFSIPIGDKICNAALCYQPAVSSKNANEAGYILGTYYLITPWGSNSAIPSTINPISGFYSCGNGGQCAIGQLQNNNSAGSGSGSANCANVAPSVPTLISPINLYKSITPSVYLSWGSVSSWGTACSSVNTQYNVYVGETNPPVLYSTE